MEDIGSKRCEELATIWAVVFMAVVSWQSLLLWPQGGGPRLHHSVFVEELHEFTNVSKVEIYTPQRMTL